jgi:hypothetical protein
VALPPQGIDLKGGSLRAALTERARQPGIRAGRECIDRVAG